MELVGERDQLIRWAETRDAKEGTGWRAEYRRANNAASIDGLPGLDLALDLQPVHGLDSAS
jgi:hypothetical protein